MSNQHRLPTRAFRARPDEYNPAKATYEAAGYDMTTAIRGFLNWTNTNPTKAVDELRIHMDTIQATAPRGRLPTAVVYAAQEGNQVHGDWDLMPAGEYVEESVKVRRGVTSPLAGRSFTVRLGVVDLSGESGRSAGHTLTVGGRPHLVSAAVWESLSGG